MPTSTSTANLLTEGHVVQLDLGGKTSALPCCILGFTGPSVVLGPIVPATAPTAEAIEAGRAAYVVIDHDEQVHALRATVRPGSDPGRDPRHRHATRSGSASDAATRARRWRCTPPSPRSPAGSHGRPSRATSARAASGWPASTPAASTPTGSPFVSTSPPAALRIETEAEVVRRSQRDLSLRFTRIREGDVALLTQITIAYYRLAR